MIQTYFLGANTKEGFFSLYGGFPPRNGDFLHIIKGGPGTGKSGFMRKIGLAAEKQGLDVEYVLCSGDPDSLDGVYIPALKTAWVDGTVPHVTEPVCFGVDSDYVNLGRFCRLPFSPEEKEEIQRINTSYKLLYARAYGYLSAAAHLGNASLPELFGPAEQAAIGRRIDNILDRNLGRSFLCGGKKSARFLSALSCQGEYRLPGEISKLCKLIYQFDDGLGGAGAALEYAAKGALKRGAEIIVCPSPLEPAVLEAVLIPSAGLALLGGGFELEEVRHIRIDALIPTEKQQSLRPERREALRARERALALALEKLGQAKALHDELEGFYIPHMDFPALTKYTEGEIRKFLK